MNKTLKKFFALGFSVAFVLTCGIGSVMANQSGIITVSVPRWGSWSDFMGSVAKTDNGNGGIYLNTSPHTFTIYGQLYKMAATDKVKDKALYDDAALSVGSWSYQEYRSTQKAQVNYKAAIASSNYEPDVRTVTFQYWP